MSGIVAIVVSACGGGGSDADRIAALQDRIELQSELIESLQSQLEQVTVGSSFQLLSPPPTPSVCFLRLPASDQHHQGQEGTHPNAPRTEASTRGGL